MVRIRIRPPLRRARRRAFERASSKGATVLWEAISLQQLAQMSRLQSPAIGALAPRRTSAAAVRQQYRCDRFPPLRWPATGSRRTPELCALPARYDAEYRATRNQLQTRKGQMPL